MRSRGASSAGHEAKEPSVAEITENEGANLLVFLVFAIGFVVLTLPIGIGITALSRRLAVKR